MDSLPAELLGSGSYPADDVSFLLRPVAIASTDVAEKERLIQTRQRHYSEMISHEFAPSERHMAFYQRALAQNGPRMARDVLALASALSAACDERQPVVLVSLVRAGIPLGVLLRRALRRCGHEVFHYGVSIIRDRGIDQQALSMILARHAAANLYFVDGWTGKGVIARELQRSAAGLPQPPRLVVLADPCGHAWLAASAEDWIIPSGVLGATVSGLVSRSIWPVDGGLHGSMVYHHLREADVSTPFIQAIEAFQADVAPVAAALPWPVQRAAGLQQGSQRVMQWLADRHAVHQPNRIKPGIAEATRALLRRMPEQVLVRHLGDPDVQLLVYLARQAQVSVEEVGEQIAPYRAATIIRSAGDAK